MKYKTNYVSSTMFMKLTIKVVAFFLGHPVYENIDSVQNGHLQNMQIGNHIFTYMTTFAYTDCPPKHHTIGFSASITFKIVNQSEYAL